MSNDQYINEFMDEHPSIGPITCSIPVAAALFGMSPNNFYMKYVVSGQIYMDRMRQVRMADVLKIYKPPVYKPLDPRLVELLENLK